MRFMMPRAIPRRAYEEVTFIEAQVVSYRMDSSDGGMWKLTFYCDEINNADWLFHCYPRTTVVMGVKALDYDNPDKSEIITEGERYMKRFSMLSRNLRFQKFIREVYEKSPAAKKLKWGIGRDEHECVEALYALLNIKSRKELLESQNAIDTFVRLIDEFQRWMKKVI